MRQFAERSAIAGARWACYTGGITKRHGKKEKHVADQVFIDGEFVPKAEASLPLFDHGYLYGDGVFEGVRVYNGRVFRLAQ